MKLGRMIRVLRKNARLTQAELAAASGLERTSITNIENGKQKLHEDSLNRIAKALGYEVKVKFVKVSEPVQRAVIQLEENWQ